MFRCKDHAYQAADGNNQQLYHDPHRFLLSLSQQDKAFFDLYSVVTWYKKQLYSLSVFPGCYYFKIDLKKIPPPALI